MNILNKTLLYLVATSTFLFIQTGCVFFTPYGFVAPDAEPVRTDGKKVFIPENAPSIRQGFKPHGSGNPEIVPSIHEGIDIAEKAGTPVIAPSPGVVLKSFHNSLFGNQIVIGHGKNNDGSYIRTRYFHLQEPLVTKGDKVVRGQKIGLLGKTGILAAYPHLHFEVRIGKTPDQELFEPVNPHRYWAGGIGIVTCFDNTKQIPDEPFLITYPVPCNLSEE